MFKKFTSMMTAVLLIATGISVLGTTSANATSPVSSFQVGCTQGPSVGQTVSGVNCSNSVMNAEWGLSNATWSPTVSSTFQANTVYSVTYRATPISGLFTVPTISANAFSVNTSYSGSPTGTTVTSLAATAGDPYMTITITFNDTGSGSAPSADANLSTFILRNSSGLSQITISPTFSAGTTSYTASTSASNVEIQRDVSAQFMASAVNICNGTQLSNGTSCALNLGSNTLATRVTNGQTQKTYTITITRTASSGSSSPAPSQTAEQIAAAAAAAAQAAAQAAAEARAAAVAVAQSTLATVLKGDKAGTLSEYRSANINVTTTAALDRLNAEVLKLSAADRSDFAKIKAIADKIEFDESFFNATARPTVATYNAYGVTVTPRTVATINAKVLELPVAKRADVTAIAEIAKVETFVDRVANTDTRSSVSAATLISKGLLPVDTVYKYTVVNGLSSYPEGSLNTMAKIEAAIKAELDKAGARKAKTEAIKAKIAARRK